MSYHTYRNDCKKVIKMALSKAAKIVIVAVVATGITVPSVIGGIIFINMLNQPAPDQGRIVTLFGDVEENKTISEYLIKTGAFTRVINGTYNYTKSSTDTHLSGFTGVSIWDLIVVSGINYASDSVWVRFWGLDGFYSRVDISLTDIKTNNTEVTKYPFTFSNKC